MTVDISGILDKIVSHAMATGIFERVNAHEPKSAPGSGLSCAVWVDSISPVRSSGLSSTSGRIAIQVRIFTSMLAEPPDAIDPAVVTATDVLLSAYSGDFELGDTVRCVDLLGMAGEPLSAKAGYLSQDKKLFRVMTIMIPLIVNDLWNQVA